MTRYRSLVAAALLAACRMAGAEPDVHPAQRYREAAAPPVEPVSDSLILCEAEEFRATTPGWQAQSWGSGYYAATFANTFLSRKAFLGAPEQCDRATATLEARVPQAGRYLALVRFEAPFRFEARFRLVIEQAGKTKLDRLYGARENLKICAFGQKIRKEIGWGWGGCENMVWEGHDAAVELEPGPARLTLVADRQPGPGGRRNVDLVMLTRDEAEIKTRIDKEGYLPLDGLLTQAGDVYFRLHNPKDGAPLSLAVGSATEHSPYWIHLRAWKPKTIEAAPGQTTDWVEVGSLLDSLNDGQWTLQAKGDAPRKCALEVGVRAADGKIGPICRFDPLPETLELAYDADTRYSRRIRPSEDVLYDLVDYLKKHPVRGAPPKRTIIYGETFAPRPGDPAYTAARDEFIRMMGATALVGKTPDDVRADGLIAAAIDLRGLTPEKLEKECRKFKDEHKADRIASVSLGDEIGLESAAKDDHAGFRAWLQSLSLKPSDVDPAAGDHWEKVLYTPDAKSADRPGLFYYSKRYGYRCGIRAQKALTDVLRRWLPNAGIGANYSPQGDPPYLGETHMWVSLFREGGMTMPWGEDYIFLMPMGTEQMNALLLDLFRAGVRDRPEAKIHFYVMPHVPGNTPTCWRRQFYDALAHGAKIINLFEFRPVQAAYTENYVNAPEMFQEVRRSFHELGLFEDVVQDGHVRPGIAGLWFSEAADVWGDNRASFAAGKRTLCIAVRHQQLPLDVVVEEDALSGALKDYAVLYLTDGHVSRAASRAIAQWVEAGGRLFATAGAGMLDEFNRPNEAMRALLGIDEQRLELSPGDPVRLEKQDLPVAEPMDTVTWGGTTMPAIGARSRIRVRDAEVQGRFTGGLPAVTARNAGRGRAMYAAFLPGLSYFKPAIPFRPVDRSSRDDAMAHFIPTAFDPGAGRLIGALAEIERPVVASDPLVETTVLQSAQGAVIPLVNWSAGPIRDLTLTVRLPLPAERAALAGGGAVRVSREAGGTVFRFDLDVADALILR